MDDILRPPPKHRRLQFSVRTLLIVVVLAALLMGGVVVPMEQARRQRSLAKTISNAGVTVTNEDDVGLLPPIVRAPSPGCYINIAEVFVETDEGMKYLKEFPNARTVCIHGQVTDNGMVHIKDVPRLEKLTLGQSKVTNAGLSHVGQLTGLQELYLCSDTISDDGLKYVGNLPELARLDLRGVDVSDAGLVHLKGLINLRTLMILRTRISGTGLEHLRELPNLDLLNLREAPVTVPGLAGITALTPLENLWLSDTCAVTDAGLSRLKNLVQLKQLLLHNVPVTDVGLAYLEDVPSLNSLDIKGTSITDEGIRRFRRTSRGCDVSWRPKRQFIAGCFPEDARSLFLSRVGTEAVVVNRIANSIGDPVERAVVACRALGAMDSSWWFFEPDERIAFRIGLTVGDEDFLKALHRIRGDVRGELGAVRFLFNNESDLRIPEPERSEWTSYLAQVALEHDRVDNKYYVLERLRGRSDARVRCVLREFARGEIATEAEPWTTDAGKPGLRSIAYLHLAWQGDESIREEVERLVHQVPPGPDRTALEDYLTRYGGAK